MKQIKTKMGLKENISAYSLKNVSKEDVEKLRKGVRGSSDLIKELVAEGKIIRIDKKENLIADVGVSVFAQRLAGEVTNSGVIEFGALGTGTTPPTASDTTLETEVFRKETSSSAYDGNTAYIDFFIDKADVDGTFTEFGNFIDGDTDPDTGILFSKVTVDWEKTDIESLFIACEYTITSI